MLAYPNIDPVALDLGKVKVTWYFLSYLVGFFIFWRLTLRHVRKPGSGWKTWEVNEGMAYAILGVILGGRLGYVLFYNPGYFMDHPWDIFKLWQGGRSFHGAALGLLVVGWLYTRSYKKTFLQCADIVIYSVAPGIMLGRIANFINNELWGRVSDVPWAMVFPGAGPLPRHPSQLYEAILEGPVLLALMLIYGRKPRPRAAPFGVFLMGYGVVRFTVEFFRQPDKQLGFIALDWVTMGQVLCLAMFIPGLVLYLWAHSRKSEPVYVGFATSAELALQEEEERKRKERRKEETAKKV